MKTETELTEAQKVLFELTKDNLIKAGLPPMSKGDFIKNAPLYLISTVLEAMERYAALKSAPSIPIADFIKKWNVAFEDKEQEAEFASEMFNDLVKLSNELKSNHVEEQPNNGLGVSAFDSTFNPEIKAKSEERETGWISVEETPKIGNNSEYPFASYMLLLSDGEEVYYGQFENAPGQQDGGVWMDSDGNDFGLTLIEITHWMPLPAPPKV